MQKPVDPELRELFRLMNVLSRSLPRIPREPPLVEKPEPVLSQAQMQAEAEFYLEVKQALMDEGKSHNVAVELINTEKKMLDQARRLKII